MFADNGWNHLGGRAADDVSAVVPSHLGGSSPIKHVFVIIKENRTYDQVLGDMPQGNGDPTDAQFGAKITPNQHALAERFGLFDNFYDVGTLSADGHNWIVQAEPNDYAEKEFGAFYRSYPSQGGDALAYQRDGFLWNAAQRAGLSVADFGEYCDTLTLASPAPTWTQWYTDAQDLEKGASTASLPTPISAAQGQLGHPLAERDLRPRLPRFRPGHSRPVPGRHLGAGLPQVRADGSACQPHVHVAAR